MLLRDYIETTGRTGPLELVGIFISLSKRLNEFHNQKIVYNDLHPGNIWVDPESGTVSLTPSALSSDGSGSDVATSNTDRIIGEIAYISPERTGRTAHTIDIRSDLYALGVVLHEVLTGAPPFDFSDPAGIIHGHMAVDPTPVHKLNKNIPPVLSEIVSKLLSKSPVDRYQSTQGLIADLAECLDQLKGTGKIQSFPIARKDVSSIFSIPPKLYGRYTEIQLFIEQYQHASKGGVNLLFFSGPPGIGKTCLVDEAQAYLVKDGGAIIHGKYDQYERINPCSAIIQAFHQLVRWILTQSDKEFQQTRKCILDAVGDNGQVLVDVIPDLELIIGQQPPVEPLAPQECRNRLSYVLRQFVRSVAKSVQPLILFLDDLQWADNAALQLLEAIFSDIEMSHLLFIGCYRDVEAKDNLLFSRFLETLNPRLHCHFVDLDPVGEDHVAMLLEDALALDVDQNRPLIRMILEKTNGNPLFIKEFLINLHTNGWIQFVHSKDDRQNTGWQVDMDGIRKARLPDTVVDLLTGRILKLPDAVQEMLKVAACIGMDYTADLLCRISGQPPEQIDANLKQAIDQDLVIPGKHGYKFIHDRVQEAAYDLIQPDARAAIHYAIAKALMPDVTTNAPGDDLFPVTSQFNACRHLLNAKEIDDLVVLNLKASRKAKMLTAYPVSMTYLRTGIDLLKDNSWETQYRLTLDLYTQAAEAAYLIGDFCQMDRWVSMVIERALSVRDKIHVHETRIRSLFSQNRHPAAIREGIHVLKQMGITLPERPSKFHLLCGIVKISILLRKNRIDQLCRTPDAQDEDAIAVGRILRSIGYCALVSNAGLLMLIIKKGIEQALRYGMTPEYLEGIATVGSFFSAKIGAVEKGNRIGLSAFSRAIHASSKRMRAQSMAISILALHWKHHIRDTHQYILDGYELGMTLGNTERVIVCINTYCNYLWMSGEPLSQVSQQFAYYHKVMQQYKQSPSRIHNQILHQLILNLSEPSASPHLLRGKVFDETTLSAEQFAGADELGFDFYYRCKFILFYYFEKYHAAIEFSEKYSAQPRDLVGTFDVPVYYFYDSLCRLAVLGQRTFSGKDNAPQNNFFKKTLFKIRSAAQLRVVAANQKKLKKWAKHAPMNFANKWALVEAERARIGGKKKAAVNYYRQAVTLSKEHLYLHEEALSHELFAKFYLSVNDESLARRHFKAAYDLYTQWGGLSKCHQMKASYEKYLADHAKTVVAVEGASAPPVTPPVLNLSKLDLRLLVDASDLISGQSDIKQYLTRLSEIIMRYTGSRRVVLLINNAGKLSVGIDATIGDQDPTVLKPLPKDNMPFAGAIVKYVMRTNKEVLLKNAVKAKLFGLDSYIRNNKPKSVMCMPVNHQENLVAILYIENNLNYGVFGPQHIDLLKSLCGQLALSFENRYLKEMLSIYMDNDVSATPEALMESLQRGYGLTPQEARVATLFKEGYTRTQICEVLDISLKTLRRHLQSIYDKTINYEDDFSSEGRVDKLSRLILFLFKHCESQRQFKLAPM